MHRTKLKGNLILLLTAFVWGASFIAQSKGVEEISPIAFNGIRCMLGAIVLIPVILLLDNTKKRNGTVIQGFNKKLIVGGTICGVLLCIATTLQTAGMIYTSPGKSGFITAMYMIIVPIIGLFLGKKPRAVIVISVIIAVCGMYLMCVEPGASINIGDILTAICAIVFSFHIIAIDHFSPQVDGVKLAFTQFFVCGLINIIWMLFDDIPKLDNVLNCWASIGYSGIMSCGVAYTLQIVGQKYTDPTSASIIMSLESVFATLTTVVLIALGWELTGGALSAKEITGCILMFVAIILVQLPEKSRKLS